MSPKKGLLPCNNNYYIYIYVCVYIYTVYIYSVYIPVDCFCLSVYIHGFCAFASQQHLPFIFKLSNKTGAQKQNSKSVTSCTIFFYNKGHEQRRRQSRYRGRRA